MYARSPRFLGLCVLALAAIPVVYYSVIYLNEPTLYDGDRMETRACRECGGSGKDPGLLADYPQLGDHCIFCRGRGTVDVIVPGPNRPTRIWGAVVDLGKTELYQYTVPANIRMLPLPTIPARIAEIPGALSGITVVLEPAGGDPIELKSNSTGRFSKPLAAGVYKVKAGAPGFESLEEALEIKPLTEPIWLEKARMARESDFDGNGQSPGGLGVLVGLTPKGGEQSGFVRVFPLGP
jgi:hypothetical protein